MVDALFGDPRVDAIIEALHRIDGWPADPAGDDRLARDLLAKYPSVDLVRGIAQWDVWRLTHEVPVKSWKGRIQTWFREQTRHGLERRANRTGPRPLGAGVGGAGSGVPRSSSVPGTAAEFGPSRRLDDW